MGNRVVLLDVNVLVALTLDSHVHHHAAHTYLASVEAWATCPTTECSLLRLLLNPAVTGQTFNYPQVQRVLAGMRRDRRWSFLEETTSPIEAAIDISPMVGHQQVTDFRLVDIAARHSAILATLDARLAEALAPADRRHVHVIGQ